MKYLLSAAAILSLLFLMMKPGVISSAVSVSITGCLEVVVPSLFAFTVLAVYLQKSGLYRVALRPLTLPLSKLLRMDEELCAVFVLANIGGYPVGAKLLSELVRQGRLSPKNAGRMMCFCFGSGPGFMIGIAGMRVFSSATAGLVLFGACFAAALLTAAFVRSRGAIELKRTDCSFDLSANSLINSVTSAARVMFTVCAMIIGFSAIFAILDGVGASLLFERIFGSFEIFPALLEITRIKEISATAHALPLCAALLAFGGVCVLMQIAALAKGIPLKSFVISRIPAAIIAALVTLPFAKAFPPQFVQTIAPETAVIPFSKNAVLSVCVLAMGAILLIDVARTR